MPQPLYEVSGKPDIFFSLLILINMHDVINAVLSKVNVMEKPVFDLYISINYYVMLVINKIYHGDN